MNDKELAPKYVRVTIIILILVVVALSWIGINPFKNILNSSNNTYKTELEWYALENYVFAVETNYDGDTVESGNYVFNPEKITYNYGDVPIVWDVYISNNLYNSTSQLDDSEFITSVGGIDETAVKIPLNVGNFVYVICNNMAGNPVGYLKISKVD